MTFNNHTPINFTNAETLAEYHTDGGAYDGIGYTRYIVFKGTRFHLVHRHSSGCEYNNKVDHTSQHLGVFETKEKLVEYLLGLDPQTWVNSLLSDLGYEGETA